MCRKKEEVKVDCEVMCYGKVTKTLRDVPKQEARSMFYEHFDAEDAFIRVTVGGKKLNTHEAIKFFGKRTEHEVFKFI